MTEKSDALAAIKEINDSSKAELDNFASTFKAEMSGEVKDKNGELTKVFIVDRDAPGWRRVHIRRGLPLGMNEATKSLKINEDLLFTYMGIMANVDLDDDAVLEAVGPVAIEGARSFVLGFFMLLWGSALRPESAMVS